MPRKTVPSIKMEKGCVTIGGMQTGVAMLTGPNGWNSIGHADLQMFDPASSTPALLAPGDTVRFIPTGIEL
jgi:allophanate hydrolase subunit 1